MHQKKRNNGINFNNVIRLSFSSPMSTFSIRLMRLILVAAGAYAPVACAISCIGMEEETRIFLPAVIFFAAAFELVKLAGRAAYAVYLLSGLAAAVWMYVRWDFFAEGAIQIYNSVIELVNEYYDINFLTYAVSGEYENGLLYVTILLAFLMTAMVDLGMSKHALSFPGMFFGLLFVSSGFAVGVIPATVPMLIYILYIASATAIGTDTLRPESDMGNYSQKGRYSKFYEALRLKTSLICALLLLFLFGLAGLAISQSDYDERINISETKAHMQETMKDILYSDLGDWFSDTFRVSDDGFFSFLQRQDMPVEAGLNGGKLNFNDRLMYRNIDVLTVTMPKINTNLYLKGYAAGEYTGREWTVTSDVSEEYERLKSAFADEGVEAINMTPYIAMAMLSGESRAEAEDKGADLMVGADIAIEVLTNGENYTYIPYFTHLDDVEGGYAEGDGYINRTELTDYYGMQSYVMTADFTAWLEGLGDDAQQQLQSIYAGGHYALSDFEQAYREHVYRYYTEVPDSLERINAMDFDAEGSLFDKIRYVRSYLSREGTYSLVPGEVPDGSDYIEHFLFDNHRGYCVHFASAGVMLLRKLGIPARYAEGYYVRDLDVRMGTSLGDVTVTAVSDNLEPVEKNYEYVTVNVRDRSAHAWVEVYVDGFGWIPVEMTPGFSQPDVSPTAGALEEEPTPSLIPTPTVQGEATPTPATPGQTPDEPVQQEDSSQLLQIILGSLLVLIIATAAAALIVLLLRYRFIRRSRTIDEMLPPRRVLFEFERILRIMEVLGLETDEGDERKTVQAAKEFDAQFEKIYESALRARFGDGELPQGILEDILEYRRSLLVKVFGNKTKLLRLYYEYIKML